MGAEIGPDLTVSFESDSIALDIPQKGITIQRWKIETLNPPVVSYQDQYTLWLINTMIMVRIVMTIIHPWYYRWLKSRLIPSHLSVESLLVKCEPFSLTKMELQCPFLTEHQC